MMILDALCQLLYNMLNFNPNQVGKRKGHFSATFGFEIGQVSSACYDSKEICDTEGGAPELRHRQCVMTTHQ